MPYWPMLCCGFFLCDISGKGSLKGVRRVNFLSLLSSMYIELDFDSSRPAFVHRSWTVGAAHEEDRRVHTILEATA